MVHRLTTLSLLVLLVQACSGAAGPAAPKANALQPELEPPARDLEFEAARDRLAEGPVDRYVPMKWMKRAIDSLDSDGDAADFRGDFPAALRWAGLAARAVLDRPDSDLVFDVLTQHVRVCNHTSNPDQARGSLARLEKFAKLDPIRRALVDTLTLESALVPTRLADGTFSASYLSYTAPELLARYAALAGRLESLMAPAPSDQELNRVWDRLHIAWTGLASALAVGTANTWSRTPDNAWRAQVPAREKTLLRSIWYVSSERYPKAVAQLHLRLARFYEGIGDAEKAAQNLKAARVMVLPTADPFAVLRMDLAEVDRVLAPHGPVETLGYRLGGPGATEPMADPPPSIRAPVPQSVWAERATQVEGRLIAAQTRFRKERNLRGLVATWLRRAMVAGGEGRYDEAADFLRQSESVALLAGDAAGGLVALAHLMALELKEGQIGRAQQAARRFFALADAGRLHAMALSLGEALLAFTAQEFSVFASPNQRLAALHLAARCFDRYAPPALRLRHYGRLVRVAAHFRYVEEVREYARRGTALADELLAAGNTLPQDRRPAVAVSRCALLRTASAALVAGGSCGDPCLGLAEAALACTAQAHADGSGPELEEIRLVTALARATHGKADEARALLPADDLESRFRVALRAGETARMVALARRFVATSRALLAEVSPPPVEPEEEEGAGENGDAEVAEETAPPPPPDPAAVEAARANLAANLRLLVQGLADLGNERLRAGEEESPVEFAEARALLDEWRELTRMGGEWTRRPWELLSLYGQIAASLNQTAAAWLSFSGALDAIWQARDRQGGLQARAAFTAEVAPLLDVAQRFLLSHPQEPFDVPQHGSLSGAQASLLLHLDRKAQERAAVLNRCTPFHGRLLEGADGTALQALEQRLSRASNEEMYALQSDAGARIAATRKERETVESWLEQSRSDLSRKYPRLAVARGVPRSPAPADIVALAKSRGVTFLVYALSRQGSAVWVIDGDGVNAAPVPATDLDVARLARRISAGLRARSDVTAALAQGYDWLVAPVAAQLRQDRPLAVVPDGALFEFPFAVLGKDGTSLLDEHPLFVVPSLPLYAEAARGDAGPRKEPAMLLLAEPQMDPGLAGAESLVRPAGSWLPAAGAATTADTTLAGRLRAAFGDDRVQVHAGTAASETAFYSAVADRDVVHLSGPLHTFATEPIYSGLVLAPSEGSDEDGLLQGWEIAATMLSARLAVIQWLGEGPQTWSEAEATAGLSRGFAIAGVPVVVANPVPVASRAADVYFAAFYDALAGGARACDATRRAALALKARPEFAHPAFWGTFAAYGFGDAVVLAP